MLGWTFDSSPSMLSTVAGGSFLKALARKGGKRAFYLVLVTLFPRYMGSIPKTLGSLYYSLGTQVPPKLASILPADFWGDDSTSQESPASSLPASAASDPAARSASARDETDGLQELRTRSAQRR